MNVMPIEYFQINNRYFTHNLQFINRKSKI